MDLKSIAGLEREHLGWAFGVDIRSIHLHLWALRGNFCGKKRGFCDAIYLILMFIQYVALGISKRMDEKDGGFLGHHIRKHARETDRSFWLSISSM